MEDREKKKKKEFEKGIRVKTYGIVTKKPLAVPVPQGRGFFVTVLLRLMGIGCVPTTLGRRIGCRHCY